MNSFAKKLCAAACCAAVFLCALLPAVPVKAEEWEEYPQVSADSYVVMNAETGQILVSGSADKVQYPASITKILTLGLVLEALDAGTIEWGQQVTVQQSAIDALIPGAATIWLEAGEVMNVIDLVYATQIRSANDAANVLAELLDGSIAGFADRMNAKVAELGLTSSHFVNPSGLPDQNHYTTAADMAAITAWALSVPKFRDIFSATEHTIDPTNLLAEPRVLAVNNGILLEESSWYYQDATGSKSGFTNDAAYTLSTSAKRGDTELICVVLHCDNNESKFSSTVQLLDYCFANYTTVTYTPKAGAVQVPVYGGEGAEEKLGEVTVQPPGEIQLMLNTRLGIEDVTLEYAMPDAIYIGDDFAPKAIVRIQNAAGQHPVIATLALSYTGLDALLQQYAPAPEINTAPAQANREGPGIAAIFGWVLAGIFGLMVVLFVARALYVQQRRRKRRLRRQLQAQARARYMAQQAPVHAAQQAARGTEGQRVVYHGPEGNRRRPGVNLQVYRSGYNQSRPRSGKG